MKLYQALFYFLEEAFRNLARGWRISSLAVTTTGVSLFLGGAFLLLGTNLAGAVEDWRAQARVVVYSMPELEEVQLDRLAESLGRHPHVRSVYRVTSEEAKSRLVGRYPELSNLLEDEKELGLPEIFELETDAAGAAAQDLRSFLEGLAEVEAVDDDRSWLGGIDSAATLIRSIGLAVVVLLMIAAAVTIASVVRLSTLIHRREISAMRLIGATEFFVRGPFVVEGLLQGAIGSAMAVAALWVSYKLGNTWELPWLVQDVLVARFLSASQIGVLLSLGVAAGFVGGLIPLREKSGVFS